MPGAQEALQTVEEVYTPEGENTWQVELELLCKSYLKLLMDHSGLLETMLAMPPEGPAAVVTLRFHVALAPLNLVEAQLKNALDFLADYLHGVALAMSCNTTAENLGVEMIDGPLVFYVKALALEA